MAKTKTPHHIDYDTLTVDGKFQKVARNEGNREVQLVECWAVRISPRSSQKAISCAKKLAIDEPISLQHLKRLVKEDRPEGPKLLLLVCSVVYISSKHYLVDLFEKELDEKVTVETIKVPENYPSDKEKCAEWSKDFWPVIWRGSSVVQEMNAVRINVKDEEQYLQMAVDQALKNFEAGKRDDRENSLLSHSVINCIQEVAKKELRQRSVSTKKGYLCLNMHVFTTHEPCDMCTMALVHSRVGKLVYILDAGEKTGGCSHGIHNELHLNWKFDAWKWCGGDQFKIPNLHPSTYS